MGWLPERDRSRGNRAGRWFATSRRPAHPEPMINYEELADNISQMREILQAMVAGLMEDGFSEEQARRIVTATLDRKDDDDGNE